MSEETKIEEPQLKTQKEAPKAAKKGVAGFWIRALALVMDFIILQLLFHVLFMALKEQFFQMSSITPYIGGLIVFCYLWLGNGPVGKGRTLGKFLLRIRVQDYYGKPLDYLGALKRNIALIIFLPYFSKILAQSFTDKTNLTDQYILGGLSILTLALMIANAFLVGLSSKKQGYHDIFARSLVTRGGSVTFEWLENQEATNLLSKKINPAMARQISIISFIVISALLGYNLHGSLQSKLRVTENETFKYIRDNYSFEGFELVGTEIRPEYTASEKNAMIRAKSGKSDSNDTNSTATLQQKVKYEFIVILMANRNLSAKKLEENQEIRKKLPELRDWSRDRLYSSDYDMIFNGIERPKRMKVEFVEYLDLFVYMYQFREGIYVMPLDDSPVILKNIAESEAKKD